MSVGKTMILYGMGSPNVEKVILMLEEMGQAYEIRWVDVFHGGQHEPAFRNLAPNGKVPLLVDPDGPEGQPLSVWESGAILLYLAEKSGRSLPASGPARYAAVQWLMLQMSGVGPMFGQALHFQFLAEDSYARTRFRTELCRLLDVLEARLTSSPYLAGDYSIADMATFPWVRLMGARLPEAMNHPSVARWHDEISARPAVQRAIAQVKQLKTRGNQSKRTATAEMMDRYYGRGAYATAGFERPATAGDPGTGS